MRKLLGIYEGGMRHVKVFTRDGRGAEFSIRPRVTEITIGMSGDWWEVVSRTLHELLELSLVELNSRWAVTPDYAQASDGYLFVASHAQFSEAVARSSLILVNVLPDLAKRKKSCAH